MFDQRKKLAWQKLKVGMVVTGALAILFFAVLFAGSIQNLFASKATIYAAFHDVKGLRPGAPVWFAGIQIGSVESIGFAGDKITAAMTVDRDALAYLKKDSEASIQTLGLLGDKFVEVSPGSKESEGLEPGDVIAGSTRPEIDEQLSQLVNRLESKKGTLGRLMEEDTLYDDLLSSAKDIRRFAETLKTRGTVNRLIEDESLYKNVNEAAAKLNILLDKINKEEGPVGSLVSSKELKEDLQTTLKELNSLIKDIKEHPKKYFKFSVF